MQKIEELRKLFLENSEVVGEVEETFGNYNKKGELIKIGVPTITTEFCEIGSYDDIVYFTFVIYSDSFDKKIFDNLKNFSNFQIYGFKNFLENLYPEENFNLEEFENIIRKEKYFQINFDYSVDDSNEDLYNNYIKIKNKILESRIKVVNQLKIDLTKDDE